MEAVSQAFQVATASRVVAPAAVDAADGATILGISERNFHERRRNDPRFPKAIVLGPQTRRYLVSELLEYLVNLPRAAGCDEPAQLRQARASKSVPADACSAKNGAGPGLSDVVASLSAEESAV